MKIHRALFLLSGICGLDLASSARAETVADLQAKFSLALKVTANTPPVGYYVKGGAYESIAKFVTVTITQRDLLADLISEGKIAAPLAGWSIVARATSESAFGLEYALFAVKKGQPDYAMDGDEQVLDLDHGYIVESFKARYLNEYFTGSGTLRYNVFGPLVSSGETIHLSGNVTLPYAYKVVTLDSAKTSFALPGTVSLKLFGDAMLHDDELGEFAVIVEGSMSFSAHAITAVRIADSE